MERWCDKIAVVTGASAGIGTAICDALIKNGLKVVGLARRKERLDDLEGKFPSKRFYGVQCDMTKETDITKAFNWIKENVGPISVLVNNAGVAKPGTFLTVTNQSLKDTLETNILGLTIATKEAIKNMQENQIDGHVFMINSVVGHYLPPITSINIYPASKHAVTALTEGFRFELESMKSKIKISSISPGLVETEILEANGFMKLPETTEILKGMPALQSKDVADSIVFVLATPPHVQISELTIRPVGSSI